MGLYENSYVYEEGLHLVGKSAGIGVPGLLQTVKTVARFAWLKHPGRFADGGLENPLLEVAQDLLEQPGYKDWMRVTDLPSGPSSLHVGTSIKQIGGHSRVIAKWAKGDDTSSHTVVLTQQTRPIPQFLQEVFDSAKAHVVLLPASASQFEKAGMVRALAARHSRVILHHDPNDVVPVVAFSAKQGPSVAMFNHAHFSFSLGATVSDLVVNTFEYFSSVTRKHRFPPAVSLLTLTPGLTSFRDCVIDKAAAKKSLGLSSEVPVLMSIGQEGYFAPANSYDFFRTLKRLLASIPEMHVFIVGVRSESPLIEQTLRQEPRLHLLGPMPDPRAFYEASDVCLESFPMPSLGALAEAVAFGEVFPVPVYGPSENILRVSQSPVLEYRHRPATEDEYVEYVAGVIGRKSEFRDEARQMRRGLVELDSEWPERLRLLNQKIDALSHPPRPVPVAANDGSEDSHLLAGRDSICVGQELDRIFPAAKAIGAHWRAARHKMQPWPTAIKRVHTRTLRSAFQRITKSRAVVKRGGLKINED